MMTPHFGQVSPRVGSSSTTRRINSALVYAPGCEFTVLPNSTNGTLICAKDKDAKGVPIPWEQHHRFGGWLSSSVRKALAPNRMIQRRPFSDLTHWGVELCLYTDGDKVVQRQSHGIDRSGFGRGLARGAHGCFCWGVKPCVYPRDYPKVKSGRGVPAPAGGR